MDKVRQEQMWGRRLFVSPPHPQEHYEQTVDLRSEYKAGLRDGYAEAAQTITHQAEEIELLRGELLQLQHMERTVLAWFQCQLDYAAHEGESRPYSMAYSKLIEDKIFNEHALKECLSARQLNNLAP